MSTTFFQKIFSTPKNIIITLAIVFVPLAMMIIFWPREDKQPQVNTSPIKLVWWSANFNQSAYQNAINSFKAKPQNSNIQIDIVTKDFKSNGKDYYQNLIKAIATDSGPDIFSIRADQLPQYQELMLPLQIFSGEILNDYQDSFVDLVVRDTISRGSVYGVASYVDNLQLFYNKDILNQANIALPPSSWEEMDKQINLINRFSSQNNTEFSRSIMAMGAGNRSSDGYLKANIDNSSDILAMLIMQNGGQLYDHKNNVAKFNTSTQGPIYTASNFYLNFGDDQNSRYSWDPQANMTNIEAFSQGRLAYLIHYSQTIKKLQQINPLLNFDIAELPQLNSDRKKTYGRFIMNGINRKINSKKDAKLRRLAAERFLLHLTTYKSQLDFSAKTSLPGARKDIIKQQQSGDRQLRIFSNGALVADNYYKNDAEAVENMWNSIFYKVHYETGKYSKSPNSSGQASEKSLALQSALAEAGREYQIISQSRP